MKKILIILLAVFGFGIITNAQDIILKKDGSEIKAKVLEITDQQIKYKEFDFQDGPIRNINNSEVFMITYENGRREVFNKQNDTVSQTAAKKTTKNCAKKIASGIDLGLGGSFATKIGYVGRTPTFFAPSMGIRGTYHLNPYFGIDFIKLNWITDVYTTKVYSYTPWQMRIQIMSGIRGNTPSFYKCISGYAVVRLGYAMHLAGGTNFYGLGLETEMGINFSPTVFAGFAYNYHTYFGDYDSGLEMHTFSFRLGFNIGQ